MSDDTYDDSDFDLVCPSTRLGSGLTVHALTAASLRRFVDLRMQSEASTHIVTVDSSTERLMRNVPAFARAVQKSDVRMCDGFGVQLAAWLRDGVILPRTSRVALTAALLEAAIQNRWTVMIVGLTQTARIRVESRLLQGGVQVFSGTSMQITSVDLAATVIAPYVRNGMVILVALDVMQQELLIAWLRRLTPAAAVFVGVGAALDCLAPEVRSPPAIIRPTRAIRR